MARDPNERPQSMADLARLIREVEASLAVTPAPVIFGARPKRDSSGQFYSSDSDTFVIPGGVRALHRSWRWPLVVGVVLAGFFGGLLVLRTREPEKAKVVQAAERDAGVAVRAVRDANAVDVDEAGPPDAEESTEIQETSEVEEPEATSEPEPKHGPSARPKPARPVPGVLSQTESRALLQSARDNLSAQRFDDARAAFERLVQAGGKTRGPALLGLAKIAFQKQAYKEAVERANEATKAGGGIEARVLLGDAYFRLEKFAEARKAYEAALKLDPENRTARQNLDLVEHRGN
jgi:TolA-binding protein